MDFSLRDLWWLQPKGPDNPLPAMQLGASIVQHKAQMDIKERELQNDIARTSLMRDAQLSKLAIQTKLDAGNAEIAKAIAGVNDWTDPEQVQKIYDVGAQYPMVVGGKAWQGAEYMTRNAITAKRLSENTQSLIKSREDRAALNAMIEQRRALVADSTVDVNDARIEKLNKDISLEERRLAVQEGNLGLRRQEVGLKENRFNQAKWAPEDREEYRQRSKAIQEDAGLTQAEKDQALQETRQDIEDKRQQREDFKAKKAQREGFKTAPPTPAIPAPISSPSTNRVSVIAPNGKIGDIPESQLEEALKAGYKRQ